MKRLKLNNTRALLTEDGETLTVSDARV